MSEPLVSIKMITYNHGPYIAQAIEGVLQQRTTFPIELVIGEDCSTDGTREIVRAYEKQHPGIIRVITSDRNVGVQKNGYRTVKACTGKYLAFCEGDDYWHHPDKLQKQVDYLESHPECGLVYSSYDVHHVGSQKRTRDLINQLIRKHNWQRPDNPSVVDFLGGRPRLGFGILTCTVMVRRQLCEEIIDSDPYLYQNNRFFRGDTQLWAETAQRAAVHYLPESLATYRQTDESATHSKDITKLVRLQISDAELGLYLCDKYHLPAATRSELEARRYNGLLRMAFYQRNAELADEVRGKKTALTRKEWFLYFGARSNFLHRTVLFLAALRNMAWTIRDRWQKSLRCESCGAREGGAGTADIKLPSQTCNRGASGVQL
ncbi:MAG: glycosyltransferase [Nitrospiraceae bacterium]|nr:glycosyltransferase [Nitrospiraceae bacterium]